MTNLGFLLVIDSATNIAIAWREIVYRAAKVSPTEIPPNSQCDDFSHFMKYKLSVRKKRDSPSVVM
jgi:hypothetical protein